jgi:hypothetical protein
LNRISIDRLEIRLRGVPVRAARAASADLGRELLAHPGQEPGLPRAGARRVNDVDAGTLRVPRNGSTPQLRRAIVGGITRAIASEAQQANRKEA